MEEASRRFVPRTTELGAADVTFISPTIKHRVWKKRLIGMTQATKETLTNQWAAPVLLLVLLTYSIYSNHNTDQKIDTMNNAIIVLQTQKEDAEKMSDKDKIARELKDNQKYEEDRAWRETMMNKMNRLDLAQTGKLPKVSN